jgi:hypothetical protein
MTVNRFGGWIVNDVTAYQVALGYYSDAQQAPSNKEIVLTFQSNLRTAEE